MVDLSGVTGMIVLAILALGALFIIWSFIKEKENEEIDEEEGVIRQNPAPVPQNSEISDEEFIESYTDPIMEDARESLGSGVDSIKTGLDCYDRGLWEEASNDFHSAVKHIEEASDRLREIPGLIEDQGLKPVMDARALQDRCRGLRAMAIRMEEASDAMVEGNELKAREDAKVMDELKKMADSFK